MNKKAWIGLVALGLTSCKEVIPSHTVKVSPGTCRHAGYFDTGMPMYRETTGKVSWDEHKHKYYADELFWIPVPSHFGGPYQAQLTRTSLRKLSKQTPMKCPEILDPIRDKYRERGDDL